MQVDLYIICQTAPITGWPHSTSHDAAPYVLDNSNQRKRLWHPAGAATGNIATLCCMTLHHSDATTPWLCTMPLAACYQIPHESLLPVIRSLMSLPLHVLPHDPVHHSAGFPQPASCAGRRARRRGNRAQAWSPGQPGQEPWPSAT